MYVCVCVSLSLSLYIYIYREREREIEGLLFIQREKSKDFEMNGCTNDFKFCIWLYYYCTLLRIFYISVS